MVSTEIPLAICFLMGYFVCRGTLTRNRTGIARFMAEILVLFWVIRGHGDSRKYWDGKAGGAAGPRSIGQPELLRSLVFGKFPAGTQAVQVTGNLVCVHLAQPCSMMGAAVHEVPYYLFAS